jgi:hypothetical protein
MSQISAVEVRFKQFLNKEKKVEVVQGSAGDNYAHNTCDRWTLSN